MNEKISRSELKRQHKRIEKIAQELAGLGDQELNRMPGSDEIKCQIRASRKNKGGDRKRQIKYIAKILKQEPVAEILNFLSREKGSKLEKDHFLRDVEQWRDRIITEALAACGMARSFQEPWEIDYASSSINEMLEQLPEINEQDIRQAVYQYVRSRNRKYYRELFRIIMAAAEKQKLKEMMS